MTTEPKFVPSNAAKLKIEDFEKYSEMMNMLMGPNVEERKQFIMKNVDFSNICE